MKKLMIVFLCGSALAATAQAALLPTPKLIEDKETYFYLKKIRNAIGKIEIVTTDPNGNRRGTFQDVLIYNDSGTYTLKVNTDTGVDGGTTWSSVS